MNDTTMRSSPTCLEVAAEAWQRGRVVGDTDPQVRDLLALIEFGMFSNRHLQAITGLPKATVASFSRKSDHTGGRLAPRTLPLMLQFAREWEAGQRNRLLLASIVQQGTSLELVSKLTGINRRAIQRLAA